jgi:hypothetical protein|tara:strand:- start:1570 stop:2061 length:492 start_codon:yes stop_codon:yes gene_type:complete
MATEYNILTGNSQVKGKIGEILAAHYLSEQGFIINKPYRVLKILENAKVPNNYEVQFLNQYQKTMDYFAVYPRVDPLLIRREAICETFTQGGLNKYTSANSSKGYVVEVKTCVNKKHGITKRQLKMFHLAEKLGFGGMLIFVKLKENYSTEIVILKDREIFKL